MEYVRTVVDLKKATHFSHVQKIYPKLLEMDCVDVWGSTKYAASAYDSVSYKDEEITQYFDANTDWNRQAVLARFAVLEDVYLGHTATIEDNLGNTKTKEHLNTRNYNADGTVKTSSHRSPTAEYLDPKWDDYSLSGDLYAYRFDFFRMYTEGDREYDESGYVSKIKYINNGKIDTLWEVSYNTD